MSSKKIIIAYNTVHYVVLFRKNLIRSLLSIGCQVYVVAPSDDYVSELLELGCKHIHINVAPGISPLKDAIYFFNFLVLLIKIRPDFVLCFTVKPNIYGSMGCRMLGIKVINNISGLGSAFIKESAVTFVVKVLYRISLGSSANVFFQNPDDCAYFKALGIVRDSQSNILPGSGIDIDAFAFNEEETRVKREKFIFLFIGRLSAEKGVIEFLEAASIVRSCKPRTVFQVLGSFEHTNPSKIEKSLFEKFVRDGTIEYLGFVKDIRPYIKDSDCVCLPSYREGTPRSLLEAAALGKPLIATDVPGCRQVVREKYNGLLCQSHSSTSLAQAMLKMLTLSDAFLSEFGLNSRRMVESEYDENIILRAYFHAMQLDFPVKNKEVGMLIS